MEEKKEEKKIIIINEKEFKTYSPLTFDILKCVSYVNKVSEMDSLGLIEKYFAFIIKWWWLIIIFMIFALFTNGGIECDIVIGIILIVSAIWGNYYSECSKIAIQFNFLGVGSYSWDSFEAANNTLKEADYLIPKLKECEKQTDEVNYWKMYLELVKEMDTKYGDRKHMLGRPFKKGEYTSKEKEFRKEKIQEAREIGKMDAEYCVKQYLINVREKLDTYRRYKYSPYKLKSNQTIWLEAYHSIQNLNDYIKRYQPSYCNVYKPVNNKQKPWDILPIDAYEEEFNKRYNEVIGQIYNPRFDNDINKWKISMFVSTYAERLYQEGIQDEDYFSLDDRSCLEGKLLYEYREQLMKYMDIAEIFLGLTKYSYEQYCEAVDKFGLSKEDLITIYKEGRNIK